MTVLRETDFKGAIPRLHPRLLPRSFAQVARNTRLDDGTINPMRASVDAHTLGAAARTFLRHQGLWMGWNADVDAVPGPVAADRLYITGDGSPKLMVDDETYPLALPAPADAPGLLVTGGTPDPDLAEEILYAYTWVTKFDEESQPSPASARVLWSEGLNVTVSGFSAPPAGRGIDRVRLYRSETSALGVTDLYFVDEFSSATTSRTHDLDAKPLAEPLPSTEFDLPPANLRGITAMPNGMLAAFAGKELFFCEPYIPHAWPRKYALVVDQPIVGLAAFGSTLAVLTTGSPYIAQGLHPDSVAIEKVEASLPCMSKRGIVDLGYAAAYPSADGLVLIDGSGARLATAALFTREDWRGLVPSSIIAGQHGGRYVFSYPRGNRRAVGVIDVAGQQPFFVEADDVACGFWTDASASELYLLVGTTTGTRIRKWDAGAHLDQVWRSGVRHLPAAMNFGVIQVEGDPTERETTFAARVYADGVLVATVQDWGEPTRLPGGFLALRWEVEILGNLAVSSISLAHEMADLFTG